MVLSLLLRLGSAIYLGNEIKVLPGIADQVSYHNLALRVLHGHGFSFGTGWWPATPAGQPTAHWSYLYVLFLAGCYFVFGPYPIVPRLIQAVLAGFLQPLLTWRIGRRLFGNKVGLVAAGIASVYAYFVFYAGALMTESFCMLALLSAVDLATAMVEPGHDRSLAANPRTWVNLGLALAAAALLRQIALFFVPVVLAWVVWRIHQADKLQSLPARRLIRYAGLSVAVVIVCILPCTVRNFRAFGQFVPINTNAGFAFFWGNHSIHQTEFIPVLPESTIRYAALIPPELRGLNEAALDRALFQRGLQIVADDPIRYMRLCASRIAEYVRFWPSHDSRALSNYSRVLSFGLYLPLLISGVGMAFGSSRSQYGYGAAFVLLLASLYSLFHLLTWTLIRYRLPVDALTMPFGGLAIVHVREWLARPRAVVASDSHS